MNYKIPNTPLFKDDTRDWIRKQRDNSMNKIRPNNTNMPVECYSGGWSTQIIDNQTGWFNTDNKMVYEKILANSDPDYINRLEYNNWFDENGYLKPITYKFNQFGFRDAADHSYWHGDSEKPAMIALGASDVFAVGCESETCSWPHHLNKLYGDKYEVYYMATFGGASDSALRLYDAWVDMLKPELCVSFADTSCNTFEIDMFQAGGWSKIEHLQHLDNLHGTNLAGYFYDDDWKRENRKTSIRELNARGVWTFAWPNAAHWAYNSNKWHLWEKNENLGPCEANWEPENIRDTRMDNSMDWTTPNTDIWPGDGTVEYGRDGIHAHTTWFKAVAKYMYDYIEKNKNSA